MVLLQHLHKIGDRNPGPLDYLMVLQVGPGENEVPKLPAALPAAPLLLLQMLLTGGSGPCVNLPGLYYGCCVSFPPALHAT